MKLGFVRKKILKRFKIRQKRKSMYDCYQYIYIYIYKQNFPPN